MLVGAVVATQLADLLTTHHFIRLEGIQMEGNPVVRGVYNVAGMPGIYALKLGAVYWLVSDALAKPDEFERERALVTGAWNGLWPAVNNLDIALRG